MSDMLILLLPAAYVVGLSKGGLTSIGTLVVPFLAFWFDPLAAAAMMLPVFLTTDAMAVSIYHRHMSRRNLAILIPAGLFGTLIGTITAPFVPSVAFLLLTGAIGLVYCLTAWRRGPVAPRSADIGRGLFWGTMTGITSFVALVGAPPYQTFVLPQRLPKEIFAGTTVIFFASINLAKIPAYASLGQFGDLNLVPLAAMAVAAAAGVLSGRWLVRVLSERHYRRVIEALLFLLSVRLVVSGTLELLA